MQFHSALFIFAFAVGSIGCAAATPAVAAPTVERTTATTLFEKGRAAARAGDGVRAEEYLRLAIERGYDQQVALPELLTVCVSNMHLRAALGHATAYLTRHPEDDRLRYLVATILAGLGRRSDARVELTRLLRHAPDDADAHFLLGVLETDVDVASARIHFLHYLSSAPKGDRAPEIESRLADLAAKTEPVPVRARSARR